jgi:hypothetical protein
MTNTEDLLPDIHSTAEVVVPLIQKFNFRGSIIAYAVVNAQPLLNSTINSEMKKKLEVVAITDQDPEKVRTRKAAQIARVVSKFTVVRYLDKDKVQVVGDIDAIAEKCPPQNLSKIFLVSAAHLKEGWLTKGSYICRRDRDNHGCGKVHYADIDPRSTIPEGIENDRMLMTDIRDYYREEPSVFKDGILEYTFKYPHTLKGIDGVDFEFTRVTIAAPSFQTFQKAMTEAKRIGNSGLWIIHDSIVNINDFDEETTKKIIAQNSFERIMSFNSIKDKEELVDLVNNKGYFYFKDFELTCVDCFTETTSPFDATNHFLSLYR